MQHDTNDQNMNLKIRFDLTLDDHMAFAEYQYENVPEVRMQIIGFSRMLMIIGPVICLVIYYFTKDLAIR